jgi:hypothetical protein
MYSAPRTDKMRTIAQMTQAAKETATAAASVAKITTPPARPMFFSDLQPHPRPTNAEGPRWSGGFRPERITKAQTLGNLGEDELTPIEARPTVDWTNITPMDVPQPGAGNTGPQQNPYYTPGVTAAPPVAAPAQTSFWSGLGNLFGSTVSKLATMQSSAAIAQAQQRALAQTWNPAITGPALQAQAYQNAFLTSSGTPMSTSTMALIGAGLLGIFLIARK